MNPKLTSIVIPCYNQAQFLPDAINSALSQTVPVEILVVAMDDKSQKVAKQYGVKVIPSDRLPLPVARNTGIRWATGPYILPLDADDKIREDCVEKMEHELLKNEADIIYSDVQDFGLSNRQWDMPKYDFEKLKYGNQMCCCSMYKKQHWQEVGGYDESLVLGYEDWQFWVKMGSHGHFGKRIPEPLFFYRIKENTMMNFTRMHHAEAMKAMINSLPEVYKGIDTKPLFERIP